MIAHSVQWVGDWQLCDQSTGVGKVAFVLCDSRRICLFSRFLQAPFDKSSLDIYSTEISLNEKLNEFSAQNCPNGSLSKVAKFYTKPYNYVACLPNPF